MLQHYSGPRDCCRQGIRVGGTATQPTVCTILITSASPFMESALEDIDLIFVCKQKTFVSAAKVVHRLLCSDLRVLCVQASKDRVAGVLSWRAPVAIDGVFSLHLPLR
jgi:hypothetical protein